METELTDRPQPRDSLLTRRRVLGAAIAGIAVSLLRPAHGTEPPARDVEMLLEPIRRQYDLPAMAAAVLASGTTPAIGAVGVRKYGTDVPVTTDDQFHLGSDTKAMTATLCGMLVESGGLHWNTTLAEVFPHIPMQSDYHGVTLDHLLAHRSGFSPESWPAGKTFFDMHNLPGPPQAQRAAYVRLILGEPAVTMPGAQFVYSNRNYAVAGAMLEDLTGVAWEALIRRKLFRPLGMTTAGFGAMGTPGRMDQPWQHVVVGGRLVPISPGPLSDNPPATAPAAAVHCSVGDWARFVALHLTGEDAQSTSEQNTPRRSSPARLLRPETLRRLHTPQFGGDYAGGWLITRRPWTDGSVLTHAGSNTQNYAVAWVAPLRDFAVLVVTNQGGDAAARATDDAAAALLGRFLCPP